ncbi:unnamed protein product [Linum trigynum]|uniref:Uncharacterized protein n=1 Tax=Linum trigynum TaxID=586398 RepID=A0AAV2DTC6_9ROSI
MEEASKSRPASHILLPSSIKANKDTTRWADLVCRRNASPLSVNEMPYRYPYGASMEMMHGATPQPEL